MSFSSKYLGVPQLFLYVCVYQVCACVTMYILSFREIKVAVLNWYVPRIGLVRVEHQMYLQSAPWDAFANEMQMNAWLSTSDPLLQSQFTQPALGLSPEPETVGLEVRGTKEDVFINLLP